MEASESPPSRAYARCRAACRRVTLALWADARRGRDTLRSDERPAGREEDEAKPAAAGFGVSCDRKHDTRPIGKFRPLDCTQPEGTARPSPPGRCLEPPKAARAGSGFGQNALDSSKRWSARRMLAGEIDGLRSRVSELEGTNRAARERVAEPDRKKKPAGGAEPTGGLQSIRSAGVAAPPSAATKVWFVARTS